jgi:hypothetical protein
MKKVSSFFACLLMIAFNGYSQPRFSDSSKNEFGVNFNPSLNEKGITSDVYYVGLQFKHHYPQYSLRLGFTGLWSSSYNDFDYSKNMVRVNDSMVGITNNYYNGKSYRLNIGLEKKYMLMDEWKFYYGIDFIGGYSNEQGRTEPKVFWVSPKDSSYSQWNIKTDTVRYNNNFIDIGFAPVLGFEYYFGKNISAGIQGYFPLVCGILTKNRDVYKYQTKFDQKYSIFINLHF